MRISRWALPTSYPSSDYVLRPPTTVPRPSSHGKGGSVADTRWREQHPFVSKSGSNWVSQSVRTNAGRRILASSNGRVSLKQLSQTSLTARSAAASFGHAGFARTDMRARRRTQACEHRARQLLRVREAYSQLSHLVLLRERDKTPSEFTSISTIATQTVCADLSGSAR